MRPRPRLRAIRITDRFLGVSDRDALWLYIGFTLLVMLILLVTALAIDLVYAMPNVVSKARETSVSTPVILAPYMLYRTVDIVSRLLVQACFFGIFLAEIIRIRRLECIVLALSGMSPIRALAPILAFGVLAGGFQFTCEAWARPAAVFAQIDLGVGRYAHRFQPMLRPQSDWFLQPDTAIRARVKTGEAPELHNISKFSGLSRHKLTQVILAQKAVPTNKPDIWLFSNVVIWTPQADQNTWVQKALPDLEVRLKLRPEQLRYFGMNGYYLKWPDLRKVAALPDTPGYADAQVSLWLRWTAVLLPGVVALMAASLAQTGFQGRRQNTSLLVALAIFGYLIVVSFKVFWVLGELGTLPPWISVLSPLFLVAGIGALSVVGQMVASPKLLRSGEVFRNFLTRNQRP